MNKRISIEVICFLFITLFLYAALSKLQDYNKFVVQIKQSSIIAPFVLIIPWLIPLSEIVVAFFLIIPRFRVLGMYGAFTLMATFSFYIIAILLFADHVPCSCGGILEKMGWTEHLIFNIVFTFLAVICIGLLGKLDPDKEKVFV